MEKEFTYELLEALKKGDSAALESIYKQWHPVIFHYLHRFIQNEALVKEATADVFIILWKKRAIIDPHRPVQALLYKLAKDVAFDYLKKIASNKKLRQQYIERYSTLEVKNSEVLLVEKEQLAYFEEIVDTMPPKRSQVFKMRYFEGKDNQIIAQQLGISINTVKVHLARARDYLKQQLNLNQELFLVLLWFYLSQS